MLGLTEATRRFKATGIVMLLIAATGWDPGLNAQMVPGDAAIAKQFSRAFAGDISVQRQLGLALEHGHAGVQQNIPQAAYWLGKAAGLGDPFAQTELGTMYLEGSGVPKDATKAAEWFQRAALSNYGIAEHNLGTLYYQGRGVNRDVDEAIRWFRKAAERGLPQSELNLGILALSGFGGDDHEAIHWLQKAAHHHFANAWFALGYAYEKGRGEPQDFSKATKLYMQAADENVAAAHTNLGLLFETGKGVPLDLGRAKQHFLRAAELGDPFAYVSLARVGLSGVSREPEFAEIYFWLRAAEMSLTPNSPLVLAVQAHERATGSKLSSEARAAAEQRANEWVAAHPATAVNSPLSVDIARN
jgi:TPR repeat protein